VFAVGGVEVANFDNRIHSHCAVRFGFDCHQATIVRQIGIRFCELKSREKQGGKEHIAQNDQKYRSHHRVGSGLANTFGAAADMEPLIGADQSNNKCKQNTLAQAGEKIFEQDGVGGMEK
jgi:hypothetical protein